MAIFKGAGVALVTPFKDDLTVDYDQLRKLVDYQIENGTDAIIVCGTSHSFARHNGRGGRLYYQIGDGSRFVSQKFFARVARPRERKDTAYTVRG